MIARTVYSSLTVKGIVSIDQINQEEGILQVQITNFDISKIDIYRGDVSQYNSTYSGEVQSSPGAAADDDDDDFDDEEASGPKGPKNGKTQEGGLI